MASWSGSAIKSFSISSSSAVGECSGSDSPPFPSSSSADCTLPYPAAAAADLPSDAAYVNLPTRPALTLCRLNLVRVRCTQLMMRDMVTKPNSDMSTRPPAPTAQPDARNA
jgi:hypothetical protein